MMLVKFEVKVHRAQFFQNPGDLSAGPVQVGGSGVRSCKVPADSAAAQCQMAEFMNADIPGVCVPQEMIDEMCGR